MRVAVTGASGFLGQYLKRAFGRHQVDVLSVVRTANSDGPDVVSMDALLGAPDQWLKNVDAVVHAAAVRHRHGVGVEAYRASNVTLVAKLLSACAGRVRRFVDVSSVGVYGFPAALPIDETFPSSPRTLYSQTKVEAEAQVLDAGRRLGLETVIAQPCILYGKGDTNGMLDKLVRMIRAGSYRIVGTGKNTLHHAYVDDVAEGIVQCVFTDAAKGQRFILAGPETTTLRKLSETMARAVGAKLPRFEVPLYVARGVASGIDALSRRGICYQDREPPINHEKLDVMTLPIAFDIGKARRVLGYDPKVGYEEGIRRTLLP